MGEHLAIPQRQRNDSVEQLALLLTDLERAALDLRATIETACESLNSFDRDVVHDLDALQTLHDAVRVAIEDGLDEHEWKQGRILREIRAGAAS
jgi:hypothetical protein